jgi:hypothetical protein
MEMIELDIEMDNNLVAKTHDLAQRYFGDDSEASMAQVLELAFRMRSLWRHSIKVGKQETDEAVSHWQFPESPVNGEDSDKIRQWLFRR